VPQSPQIPPALQAGEINTRCHPELPFGVKDLLLHWNLLFLQSEISNLKFEISSAFALPL
jgi:hypothetical protein